LEPRECAKILEELMKRRKFISAVPAAILLGQRPSLATGQTRKEGAMANRIGPRRSEPANAGGTDKRIFSDTLWDDAMSLYFPSKAC
jgi:hypothetical protein